jgi:hypothetical protein
MKKKHIPKNKRYILGELQVKTPDGNLWILLHKGHKLGYRINNNTGELINTAYHDSNVKHFHVILIDPKFIAYPNPGFYFKSRREEVNYLEYIYLLSSYGMVIDLNHPLYNTVKQMLFPRNNKWLILNCQSDETVIKLISNAILFKKLKLNYAIH